MPNAVNETSVAYHFREILRLLPDDANREGLQETPDRVARAYTELLSGYDADVGSILKTFSSEGYDEMVLMQDIPVYSLCEHHCLPMYGKVHVGYIPDGRIVGLSKLPRLVEVFARRLQVQERFTAQVADALVEHLQPQGAMCVIEAEHLCLAMRGIQRPGTTTMTSAVRGAFAEEPASRQEFLSLIGRG